MDVSPWWLLAGVIAALLVVGVTDRRISRRRAKRLRSLAEHEGYRYSAADRFGLAARTRDALPGGSGLTVRDLMYCSELGGHAYAFTVIVDGEYGGRFVLAGRERPGESRLDDVRRGDPALPLGEQYRRLLHGPTPPPAEVSDVRPTDASGR